MQTTSMEILRKIVPLLVKSNVAKHRRFAHARGQIEQNEGERSAQKNQQRCTKRNFHLAMRINTFRAKEKFTKIALRDSLPFLFSTLTISLDSYSQSLIRCRRRMIPRL